MALFVEGTACPLCGRPMQKHLGQVITCFRPFVSNHADPFWVFSDACVHADCLRDHPLAEDVLARVAAYEDSIRQWPPTCALCERAIAFSNPDDYFGFGHLTDRPDDPLFPLNYHHYHRACLREWPGLPGLYRRLRKLDESGQWQGPALARMIEELRPLVERGPTKESR